MKNATVDAVFTPFEVKSLGSGFLSSLQQAALTIGSTVYTKHQLATDLGLVHTRAAAILTAAAKVIGAKDIADLYRRTTPYTFADPDLRVGVTTLYTMFAAFANAGLDVESWYAAGKKSQAVARFEVLKKREQKAQTRTKKKR